MSPVTSLARFLPEAALAAGAAARFSTAGGVAAYKLPELPYAYSALEPVISGQIMELHHAKHHAGYVTNLNKALEEYADAESKRDLQKMLALQGAINFNGGGGRRWGGGAWPCGPPCQEHARSGWVAGAVLPPLLPDTQLPPAARCPCAGHVNHDIFWTNLAPEKVRSRPAAGSVVEHAAAAAARLGEAGNEGLGGVATLPPNCAPGPWLCRCTPAAAAAPGLPRAER